MLTAWKGFAFAGAFRGPLEEGDVLAGVRPVRSSISENQARRLNGI
jgi:hypothetical protein